MASGFVKFGSTWIRSEEITMAWAATEPTSSYDRISGTRYVVKARTRDNGDLKHTVSTVRDGSEDIDRDIAKAQRDLYLEDLLERMRVAERRGDSLRLPIGEDPKRSVNFVRGVLGDEVAAQMDEILAVGNDDTF